MKTRQKPITGVPGSLRPNTMIWSDIFWTAKPVQKNAVKLYTKMQYTWLATENTDRAIIDAIKQEYSVAIDTISEEYRLVGSLRLAKYSRFLLDEVTPLHDELCFEEGRLMKCHATGDPEAADGLRFLAGRMDHFYQKYFHVI